MAVKQLAKLLLATALLAMLLLTTVSSTLSCNDAICHDQAECATEGSCYCGAGGKVCMKVACHSDLDCTTHNDLGLKWECHDDGHFCKLKTWNLSEAARREVAMVAFRKKELARLSKQSMELAGDAQSYVG